MSSQSDPPNRKLARLMQVLDEDIPSPEEAREAVARMDIDVGAMADDIRKQIEAHEQSQARAKFAAGRAAYEREQQRLRTAPKEPVRPRAEQMALLKGMLQRAGQQGVSVNFQKFEEADDEEFAVMLGALRFLLEGGDGEG